MRFLLQQHVSQRLLFRKIHPEDFDDWLVFHQDPRTSEFWSGLPKDPKVACQEDIDRTFFRYDHNLGGKMALVLKTTKELIGQSGLLVQEVNGVQELEIAYSLLPAFWKKGYALEAAESCTYFAKKKTLAESLISIIHVDNKPSQRVALRNGMLFDFATNYHNNPVHIYRIAL